MSYGSLPRAYRYGRLQWSSAVYKNYIYIFGGDSGNIHWIDVSDSVYKHGTMSQKMSRWSSGAAFVQNIYGYPAFLSFGGRFKDQPSGISEILFVDAESPSNFSLHEIRSNSYDTDYGPAMAQIGDNIIFVQTSGPAKDVLLWNYNDGNLKVVETLRNKRNWALPAVVSGRFFPKCHAGKVSVY